MKNGSIKQSLFQEVQTGNNLPTLKLIKVAITHLLSHGQAAKRVLNRYETLVVSLDEIYHSKHKPAVRGLRDNLVKSKIIVMVCFLYQHIAVNL